MKKYEKFTEEELKTLIEQSNTYEEALQLLGYKPNNDNRKIIREIVKEYNLNISHYINKQTNNLLGKRFGRLTVIKLVKSNGHGARWLCRCDCGNEKEIDANHLVHNRIQSCGCLNSESTSEQNRIHKLQDLTGQRFGRLVVLYRTENIKSQPAWICKCDCGAITNPIMGCNLRDGQTQSCGCLRSKGEAKIIQIFLNNNINFKTQVTFQDCLSDKGFPLKFDFGVYNNNNELQYLIEYQGQQHYYEVTWTHDDLALRQKRDAIKIQYCKTHNIPLIIIPYTEYKNLSLNHLTPQQGE